MEKFNQNIKNSKEDIENQGEHLVYYKKTTKYPQVILISE